MVEPDPTTIIWRDLDWILAQPDGLNSNNVLSYFETSPFWDPQCNNASLKMQTRFNDLKDLIMPLKKMKGIEFQVTSEKPPALWVIRKQNRLSEWEAPSLYSIIGNRVLTSLYQLHIAFNTAYQQVEFHPATGYTWKVGDSHTGTSSNKKSRIAQQDPAELLKFRNGVESAFKSTTIKLTQQWNQVFAQSQEKIQELIAGNQNDITISEQTPNQPPAQPSSPNQPNADNITRRRKKSEDSGKKKKKRIYLQYISVSTYLLGQCVATG
ncbi:1320_t:CDS:2, partial [Gigaspora margarita]